MTTGTPNVPSAYFVLNGQGSGGDGIDQTARDSAAANNAAINVINSENATQEELDAAISTLQTNLDGKVDQSVFDALSDGNATDDELADLQSAIDVVNEAQNDAIAAHEDRITALEDADAPDSLFQSAIADVSEWSDGDAVVWSDANTRLEPRQRLNNAVAVQTAPASNPTEGVNVDLGVVTSLSGGITISADGTELVLPQSDKLYCLNAILGFEFFGNGLSDLILSWVDAATNVVLAGSSSIRFSTFLIQSSSSTGIYTSTPNASAIVDASAGDVTVALRVITRNNTLGQMNITQMTCTANQYAD